MLFGWQSRCQGEGRGRDGEGREVQDPSFVAAQRKQCSV